MSGSRWNQLGVPHKGWVCVDVIDLRANGESEAEANYATCEMCVGKKKFVSSTLWSTKICLPALTLGASVPKR